MSGPKFPKSRPPAGDDTRAGERVQVPDPDAADAAAEREPAGIEVPLESLGETVLRAVIEAFVNREGTDYGAQERSFESKVADVRRQLECGEAVIVFDPETESVNIVTVR